MGRKKQKFNCPAEMTVQLIGGRWKAILLYNLRKEAKRFGELRRLSPGITQATLSTQLKELEDSGFVERVVLGRDRLSGVEYSLTPLGRSLRPVLSAMIRWGIANQSTFVQGEFGMAIFQK